jgi:GntR family transcriptional regulator, transcriptional repressor for pyruvate dehydrogenase complex
VSPAPFFKPLAAKRAFEEISEQIKESIFSKDLKPGDKLPSERELAAQFQTGRMAVREALRVLEEAGLIYIKQGSKGGSFIKEIEWASLAKSVPDMVRMDRATIDDLTEVRMSMEKMVVELAIKRITVEEIGLLQKQLKETENALWRGSRSVEHQIDFHLLVAKTTKNPICEVMIESLMHAVYTFNVRKEMDLDSLKKHLDDHRHIFRAIKSRNVKLAQDLIEKHVFRAHKTLSELQQALPDSRPGG